MAEMTPNNALTGSRWLDVPYVRLWLYFPITFVQSGLSISAIYARLDKYMRGWM